MIATSSIKFTMDERKKSLSSRSITDLTQDTLRDASRSKFSCKISEILQELHQDQDTFGPLLLNLGNDSLEETTDEDFNDETPDDISVLSSPLDVSSELDYFSSPLTVRYVSDEEDSLDTAFRSSSTSLSTSSPDSEQTASGSTRQEHSNVTSNEEEKLEADAVEPRKSSSSADSSRSSSVDEEDYDADLSGSSSDSCQRRCKRIKLS